MKIEVLLFAQLKEAYGSERFWVEVPVGARISDAVYIAMSEVLLRPFSSLPLRYAINEEFQSADASLNDNDRLALLSPVAGG